jgi:hypothetical protein
MLAGDCETGRALWRGYVKATMHLDPDRVDASVESTASMYCEGALTQREEYLKAAQDLSNGAHQEKVSPEKCHAYFATLVRLRSVLKPEEPASKLTDFGTPNQLCAPEVGCLARAGDCSGARAAWGECSDDSDATAEENTKLFDTATEGSCK